MEFKHDGITITVDGNGEFVAIDHCGNQVRKGSLSAMKTHLGKQKAETFQPFTVLTTTVVPGAEKIPDSDLYRVEVIGFTNETHGRRREAYFVVKSSDRDGRQQLSRYTTVLRDCPEAIAAYKAWEAYDRETNAIAAERENEQEKLHKVVRMLSVDPNAVAKE